MTNLTDSDIQELKTLMTQGFGELDKKIESRYNELDKKISELDKKVSVGFAELSGQIANTNTKVDSLDKRLTESISSLEKSLDKRLGNQEFIYRAVVISILATAATGVLRVLWVFPFNLN